MSSEPGYLQLVRDGDLEARVRQAYERLSRCDLCPWECGVDRRSGKLGVCKTGERARISSFGPHMGEEKPLSGWRGSGTVFFARCSLRCQYCQNYEISQADSGDLIEPERLAELLLELQGIGCHNINFVTPSHIIPQILAAVLVAAHAGLRLPLVYNTGGYDSLSALALLDGVFDIYMPDMKYSNPQLGLHYSKVRNYPAVNQAAVQEMHRQVGDLELDERGLATHGLLVRHLVLPNHTAGTADIIQFLANQVSTEVYLNLMDQYHPAYNARLFPKLNRRITYREYEEAVEIAHQAGLQRLDQ